MAALGTPASGSHPRQPRLQTYVDSQVDGWEDRDDITVVVWDPMGPESAGPVAPEVS